MVKHEEHDDLYVITLNPALLPQAFVVGNDVVNKIMPTLSGSEFKVLMYLLCHIGQTGLGISLSSRTLAQDLRLSRQSIITALDTLVKQGYVLESSGENNSKIYALRAAEQSMSRLQDKWSKNQTTPVQKLDHLGGAYNESIYISDSNSTPNVVLLESDPKLPLRLRVMNLLSAGMEGITHLLLPTGNEAEVGDLGSLGTLPKSDYQLHIRILYELWRILFGTSAEPAPKSMAALLNRYGGYKEGGSQRLALSMLRLASVDTNPYQMLWADAHKHRRNEETHAARYQDYTGVELPPEREEELDL